MKIYNSYFKENPYLSAKFQFDIESVDVCTDTRSFNNEQCFLSLKGEKFDAADFAKDLIKLPINYLILEDNQRNREAFDKLKVNFKVIWVTDSKKFIKSLAHDHLQRWRKIVHGKVVAITGTNGKTTTKESVRSLFESLMPDKIGGTKGNLNNEYGVAYTALDVKDEHEIAVFEIGTNGPGEIEDLCNIIKPDCGIITNIGDGHLEKLINREGVFQEKTALFRHISWNDSVAGPLVVDADDEKLARLAGLPKVIPIGRSNSFKYNEMQPHSVEMMWENKKIILESSNYIGEYNFKDIAMAFALVATLKKNQVEKLLSACGELKPYKFRSQIIENNDQFVFFDAYNANPTSMSLALSAYTNLNKVRHVSLEQSLFVIGQMNELGEGGEAMHRDLALKLNNIGAKHIILIGPKTKLMIDHLDGDTNYFENCENCKIFWATHRRQYKSIFMKGSRTVYLERLLE